MSRSLLGTQDAERRDNTEHHTQVTGEPRDTETVTRGSERGRWKSTHQGNSLASYSTSCPVRGGAGRKGSNDLARGLPYLLRRSRFRQQVSPGVAMIDIANGCAKRTYKSDFWRDRCVNYHYFLICPACKS